MIFKRTKQADDSDATVVAIDSHRNDVIDDDIPDMPSTDDGPTVETEAGTENSAETTRGTDMSTPPTRPSGAGFVPEIPRRAVDIPGSPVRRPGPPPGPSGRPAGEDQKLLVGKNISLAGEITACDSLVVEGTVDAKLENSRALEITESGTFRGPVRIEEATIAGRYEGDLTVRGTLTVKGTGLVTGIVRYGRLEVELGGVIRGDTGPIEAEVTDPAGSNEGGGPAS